MTEYHPIDCDQHSILELLAMRRVSATVHYDDGAGGTLRSVGDIVDVFTRSGAEFLAVARDLEHRDELRLDRLLLIEGGDGDILWRQISDERT